MVRTTNRGWRSRRRDETGTFEEQELAYDAAAQRTGKPFALAMTCANEVTELVHDRLVIVSKRRGDRSVERRTP
jgi:hypothetical protein